MFFGDNLPKVRVDCFVSLVEISPWVDFFVQLFFELLHRFALVTSLKIFASNDEQSVFEICSLTLLVNHTK